MVIRYFAWLRDHTGCAHEEFDCPAHVKTISELIAVLSARSDGHHAAFAHEAVIKVAINQEFAALDDAVSPDDEVAFFPPVTGG